jgi:putative transposase
MQTAEGVFRLQLPQVRGLRAPYRSTLWAALGRTSDVLTRMIVAMSAGGMSQRAIESAWEKALGQFVVSQSAVSAITERLPHESAALRTRDLSGFDLASLCIDTLSEPLRRWGSQTGVRCVWGICVDGHKGLLTLSTTQSASDESGLEVLRDVVKRGLQTPVTMTTDGAPGLTKAIEGMWPRSLRLRWGLHTRQHLHQKVPPQAWPACKALIADRREAPTCEEGQRRQQALRAQ